MSIDNTEAERRERGQRLRNLRKSRKMTQQQVIDTIKDKDKFMSQGTLSELESGKIISPSVELLNTLGLAYGMTGSELIAHMYGDQVVNSSQFPNERSEKQQQALDRAAALIVESEELQPYQQLVAEFLDGLGDLATIDPTFVEATLQDMVRMIRRNIQFARSAQPSETPDETPSL